MNEEQRGDFATFGGYLCSLAGEIPAVSDHIVVPDYIFTIVQVRVLCCFVFSFSWAAGWIGSRYYRSMNQSA